MQPPSRSNCRLRKSSMCREGGRKLLFPSSFIFSFMSGLKSHLCSTIKLSARAEELLLPKMLKHSRQVFNRLSDSLSDCRRRRFARAIRRHSDQFAVQTVIALAIRLSQNKKLFMLVSPFLAEVTPQDMGGCSSTLPFSVCPFVCSFANFLIRFR